MQEQKTHVKSGLGGYEQLALWLVLQKLHFI
jgi:hypothetical protein